MHPQAEAAAEAGGQVAGPLLVPHRREHRRAPGTLADAAHPLPPHELHQARDGGPHDAGAVEDGGVEGDGIHDIALAHELHDERLARRQVERVGDAVHEGEHANVPVLDLPRPVERSES